MQVPIAGRSSRLPPPTRDHERRGPGLDEGEPAAAATTRPRQPPRRAGPSAAPTQTAAPSIPDSEDTALLEVKVSHVSLLGQRSDGSQIFALDDGTLAVTYHTRTGLASKRCQLEVVPVSCTFRRRAFSKLAFSNSSPSIAKPTALSNPTYSVHLGRIPVDEDLVSGSDLDTGQIARVRLPARAPPSDMHQAGSCSNICSIWREAANVRRSAAMADTEPAIQGKDGQGRRTTDEVPRPRGRGYLALRIPLGSPLFNSAGAE
jgi:hypothetical protein